MKSDRRIAVGGSASRTNRLTLGHLAGHDALRVPYKSTQAAREPVAAASDCSLSAGNTITITITITGVKAVGKTQQVFGDRHIKLRGLYTDG